MVYADRRRWNQKYRESGIARSSTERVVVEFAPVRGDGDFLALDAACGKGQNSLFLSSIGYRVISADISDVLLVNLARYDRLTPLMVDMDRHPFADSSFDLIVVIRFLNRELLAELPELLKPGGRLIYQTFNYNHLKRNPAFNPDYVLQPGELPSALSALTLVATNDGDDEATQTWLVGDRERGAGNG